MKSYLRITSIWSMSFLVIVLYATAAFSQPTFERATEMILTESEQSLLTTIQKRVTSKKVTIVRVTNLEQLAEASHIDLPLNSIKERFDRRRATSDRTDSFRWVGGSSEEHQEVLLFYNDGYLHGMIHFGSVAINIEPLGKELVVFTELDPSSFDGCPVEGNLDTDNNQKKGHYNEGSEINGDSMTLSSSNPVIDIMVVYTPQSASASGNIQSLIDASIQSTNSTLQNSGINASVNLVHSAQVSYTESGNMITDRDRLIGTNDGHMDVVHSWRNQYGADIVVLLTASGQYCGIAGGIEVSSGSAFAVSRNDCSVGNYTFAHEIGHLIGGRHDNDPASSPRAYAHGYRYNPAYWRTVMAVVQSGINRIPYWSNPNKTYGGVAMGTSSWNDNARVWNERAATVADFKTPPPPPPPAPQTPLLAGTVSSGAPSLSWNASSGATTYWLNRFSTHPQVSTETIITTNTSYIDQLPIDVEVAHEFFGNISYTVQAVNYQNIASLPSNAIVYSQDALGGVGGMSKQLSDSSNENEELQRSLPEQYVVHNSYPNPFNPRTVIGYDLPVDSSVRVIVYDVMGRLVKVLVDSNVSAGNHQVTFDATDLNSGMYLAVFEAYGTDGQRFSSTTSMTLVK